MKEEKMAPGRFGKNGMSATAPTSIIIIRARATALATIHFA